MKIALITNNNIYIFAHLSGISNSCKVDNHLMERCGLVNK